MTPTLPGQPSLKGQRLAALFLLGVLLFNYPLLQLFARDGMLLGIPLLYCYVFCAWAALIGLMALVVERRNPS
ncbi:MAG TPA: hypothetical protein VK663_08335 [Burkholderiales bacterium]|nr:hypothetical protein [Burkholderiales bacterium]